MGWTFKGWYDENGERLNEQRRTRYETDPEYRERVLRQNRESRARKKLKDAAEKKGAAVDTKKKKTKTAKKRENDEKGTRKKGTGSGVRKSSVRKDSGRRTGAKRVGRKR